MTNQLIYGAAIGLILGAAIGFFTANAIIGVGVGIAMALGFSGLLSSWWRSMQHQSGEEREGGQ